MIQYLWKPEAGFIYSTSKITLRKLNNTVVAMPTAPVISKGAALLSIPAAGSYNVEALYKNILFKQRIDVKDPSQESPDESALPERLSAESLSANFVVFEDESGNPVTGRTLAIKVNSITGEVIGISSKANTSTGLNTVTYNESTASFPNPERGWFHYSETHWTSAGGAGHTPLNSSDLAASRTGTTEISGGKYSNRSLVFRYYVMEHMLAVDTLPQAFLDAITADAAAARTAGVKMIPRFAYSTSGKMTTPYAADAPVARVLGHVNQLKSTIDVNSDVISAVEAGFIGMWGEWYYTDNWGDTGSLSQEQWNDRARLITALLTWDQKIQILLRYPGLKHRYITEGSGTGWVAPSGATKRLGFHNDAFLADEAGEDWGTYSTFSNGLSVAQIKTYLENETKKPLMYLGETAGVSSRSTMPNAKSEMKQYRWTSLNPHYHSDVLNSWTQAERDEIGKLLGYRLRLTKVTLPSEGAAGSSKSVTLNFINDGWSAPVSAKPLQLVFVNGTTVVTKTLAADIRTFGQGSTIINENVDLPNTAGTWAVHLAIPDPNLPNRPEYAIRLANTTAWANGRNNLGITVKTT